MLGDAVLYAARRVASTAIADVERKASWTAAAATFLVSALVTALIATYQFLQPITGEVNAVALIGIGCGLIGLLCLSLPGIIGSEPAQQQERNPTAVSATVGAIKEEARQAIDYFGALRVVTAAFFFGLGAARRLRR
jgi:drug/metabolite transporter (DMT)-like permease